MAALDSFKPGGFWFSDAALPRAHESLVFLASRLSMPPVPAGTPKTVVNGAEWIPKVFTTRHWMMVWDWSAMQWHQRYSYCR